MNNIIVIGGGAAGMMAAIAAAQQGARVMLLEKNEKLGKKLFITGKGRCNFTNDCETADFFDEVCSNARFLYSAVYAFPNTDVIRFFEERGMRTKVERGGRVFPASDHSSDVIRTLERELIKRTVDVRLKTEVADIIIQDHSSAVRSSVPNPANEENNQSSSERKEISETSFRSVNGVRLVSGETLTADAVIIATGGLSYASTGSTGDGYRFAEAAGHHMTACSPSLVPFVLAEEDAALMQGLSLRNVTMRVLDGKKECFREFGEMMFTHFGATGPLVLTASTKIQKQLKKHALTMSIDLKPALTDEQLQARFLREFTENQNKQLSNVLPAMYPAKLIPVLIERSKIAPEKKVHDITKQERLRLFELTRRLTFTITGLRDYNEAIITRGGVNVKEIDPSTMRSKLAEGLYFAGEVMDVDAVTGGYNLQIAWSTGYLAGKSAAVCSNRRM